MTRVFAFLLRIYAGLTALGVALLATAVAALFASGAWTGPRVADAVRVLREGPAPAPSPRDRSEEEARREQVRRAAEETLSRRQEELRRLEARVSAARLVLEADRARLEADRRRLAESEARFRHERESAPAAGEGDAVSSNAALFSRMDGGEIAEAMAGWDDARVVRTLRALRPGKAAEVLAAYRSDPRFEREFRSPPAGAPKGSRTRLERIYEGLRD